MQHTKHLSLIFRAFRVLASFPGVKSFVARLTRIFPENRFVNSFAFHIAQASSTAHGTGKKYATLLGGSRLIVSFEEHLFRMAYFYGSHEPDLSKILIRIARPGQTWLDIGANIGVFTVTLAKCVGSTGHVIAFEPNSLLASRLRESIELNGFNNVDLRQKALGASVGEGLLNVPRSPDKTPGGSGRASLLKQESLGDILTQRVDISTLDEEVMFLPEMFGLKMDVEGFESAVLNGGTRFFAERPPKVIIFEVSLLPEAIASPNELLIQVQGFGYDLFTLPELKTLNTQDEYKGGFCENVLGIHRSEKTTREILGIGQGSRT